jgi:hypothetical protein
MVAAVLILMVEAAIDLPLGARRAHKKFIEKLILGPMYKSSPKSHASAYLASCCLPEDIYFGDNLNRD